MALCRHGETVVQEKRFFNAETAEDTEFQCATQRIHQDWWQVWW